MREAICVLVGVFFLGVLLGSLGQLNHEQNIANKAICKQLYKDTDTYLKQIHKPFLENVSKISECEGNDG